MRTRYDPFLLPTPYNEVFTDSNLLFLWPKFRSASRDYLAEMKTMRKKYLSIYGEKDPIVPVASCVRNIDSLMKASANDEYAIIVLPGVDPSSGLERKTRFLCFTLSSTGSPRRTRPKLTREPLGQNYIKG